MGEQEAIDNEFEPIVWREFDGLRVQDLSPSKIQEALSLIRTISLPKNPIWISLGIQSDEAVIEEYCGRMVQVMKDCCSIAIVCIETGRLMAVAVCKVMSLNDFDWMLWKILPTTSAQLERTFTIQYDIIKTSELSKGICFHVFDIIVADELREQFPDQCFEVTLLQQAYSTAASLKTHILSYTCFRQIESEHARNSCMQLCKEIQYVEYMDSFGNKIFRNIEHETSAYLFERTVAPVVGKKNKK